MNLTSIVVGSGSTNTLLVQPGDSISLPIVWNNSDGSARDMSLATVQFFLRTSSGVAVYSATLTSVYLLEVPTAAINLWEMGTYTATLAVTYLNREPDATSFLVLVGGTLLHGAKITFLDDAVVPQPIPGVTVEVLNPTTAEFISYGLSDSNGVCRLALPGSPSPGTDYELRLYKSGVHFNQPYTATIIDPLPTGLTNEFTVVGSIVNSFGIPSDPLMCRCSGRFVDFTNRPLAKLPVLLNADVDPGLKVPKIIGSSAMAPEALRVRTDAEGYLVVDLPRGAEFRVTFAGESDIIWNFRVPNRPSANLIDLIHPQPVALLWDQTAAPGNTITVSVGQTFVVPISVAMSDFNILVENLSRFLVFTVTDSTIVDGGYLTGTGTVLAAKAVGTTTIVPALSDVRRLYPIRLPDYQPQLPPLTVVVIP